MPLTPTEQALYDTAKAALPAWYAPNGAINEQLMAMAKVLATASELDAYWLGEQAFILEAGAATAATPDWLGQHALDRGTFWRAGESVAQLRDRLRIPADAVTLPAIMAAIAASMAAAGAAGTVYAVEIPRDLAHFGEYASISGTGGVIVNLGAGSFSFAPTADYVAPQGPYTLTLAGSTTPANDGTFAPTGYAGDDIVYSNGIGVTEAFPGTWTLSKVDADDIVVDGSARAFLSRGYRMAHRGGLLIIILPFGTTAVVASAINELVRQMRAGGIRSITEHRQVP